MIDNYCIESNYYYNINKLFYIMCKNQPTYVNVWVNLLVIKQIIKTKCVWVSLTLLRGRSSCRTRTDSLRRATKRAFWVGVAEARRDRRRELWKEHWVRNAEEMGMERTNDEAIQIPNRNEMVDRKKKKKRRMWFTPTTHSTAFYYTCARECVTWQHLFPSP